MHSPTRDATHDGTAGADSASSATADVFTPGVEATGMIADARRCDGEAPGYGA